MRAVAVHEHAIVVTSRLWQTNATAIRSGGETLLIDSPYFPDELELLPSLLAQARFEPVGLLATHADFDHLLGPLAFPELPLGVGQATGERLRAEPGAAQRELRAADARHYVVRDTPLALGSYQVLPVPGHLGLGEDELELHSTAGHTVDGTAFLWPAAGLLVAGDYLSDVEIPTLEAGGSLTAYEATLARLAPLVERSETVVPGHGAPATRERALELLDEDVAYLAALARGEELPRLPPGRASEHQRERHRANLRALSA